MHYPRLSVPKTQARLSKPHRTPRVLRLTTINIRRFGARRLPVRYLVSIMTSGSGNQPPPRPAF
ncbi:hypothetical protein CHT98_25620 (plasmid) [Azospirillum brasilense]|uniref:Uncharacterized protein n=1 Tax=Azospirillum brasilense TaxID=192 RepID=A0A235H7T8_AZOBR|nr:hypothetical protein CHT98_25620 [Azospirillum brasilense]